MSVQLQHDLPAWMTAPEIWAQARNLAGDIDSIPRARIDMGGRAVLEVPEEVFNVVGVNVYDAPEGGNRVGQTNFPIPRKVRGPMRLHCVLDAFSH